jgi:hypothetical protein
MAYLGHQLSQILEAHPRARGNGAVIDDPQDVQGVLGPFVNGAAYVRLGGLQRLRPR